MSLRGKVHENKNKRKIQDRQAGEGGNKIRLDALIGNALQSFVSLHVFFQSKFYYRGCVLFCYGCEHLQSTTHALAFHLILVFVYIKRWLSDKK